MKILNEQDAIISAQEEKSFQTICKDCIFSNKLKNDNENKNEYCHIPGRIETLEEKGGEVLSVQDPEEKDKNYKIINHRVCNMMRSELWQETQGIRHQEAFIGKDRDRLVKIARDEIRPKCTFVIYMDNEGGERRFIEDERMDALAQTMKDIDTGIVGPGEIVVINNCGIKPHNFVMRLRNRVKKLDIKCKWKMDYILENDLRTEEVLNEAIESVVKTSKNHYISIFFDGDKVPENYLSDIDSAINDQLLKFIALYPENKESLSGMFFQKLSCSIVGGKEQESQTETEEEVNVKINFLENLIKLSEQQECQELIKPLSSVVKNL